MLLQEEGSVIDPETYSGGLGCHDLCKATQNVPFVSISQVGCHERLSKLKERGSKHRHCVLK